jgi:hypothetical protein
MALHVPVPPYGGAALMGKTVKRRRDGATGVVRRQGRTLLVWSPDQKKNLTFRPGTYDIVKEN